MTVFGCFFDHQPRASGFPALLFLSREGAKAQRDSRWDIPLRAFAPSREIRIGLDKKLNARLRGNVRPELAL